MVIALNKWDAVEDRAAARRRVADALEASLAQLRGVFVVPLSAATGRGVEKLMPAVREAGPGAVVLADTRRLEECFAAVDFFEQRGVGFIVA